MAQYKKKPKALRKYGVCQRWTVAEIDFLKKNYGKISCAEMAKRVNKKYDAVVNKTRILGIAKPRTYPRKNWTPQETDFIKNNYIKLGPKKIAKSLNRTYRSVHNYASKIGVLLERESNKGRRAHKLKHRFNMTIEEYDKLFEQQQGLCAICKQPETWKHPSGATCRLCVDHCHKTKKIRGLLCRRCNRMIGSAEDDIHILKSAIGYLEK